MRAEYSAAWDWIDAVINHDENDSFFEFVRHFSRVAAAASPLPLPTTLPLLNATRDELLLRLMLHFVSARSPYYSIVFQLHARKASGTFLNDNIKISTHTCLAVWRGAAAQRFTCAHTADSPISNSLLRLAGAT